MAALIALVFLVLVSRVLPVFSQVFSQLGAGLSPVAAALLGSGSTGQIIAYILSGLLLAGAVALLLFFRGERGVRLFSRGATAEAVARGRFSSAMALMLQSGLPLDEAMERTSELLEGSPLAERFLDCAAASRREPLFPVRWRTQAYSPVSRPGCSPPGSAPACLRRPWPSWPGAARPKPMSA